MTQAALKEWLQSRGVDSDKLQKSRREETQRREEIAPVQEMKEERETETIKLSYLLENPTTLDAIRKKISEPGAFVGVRVPDLPPRVPLKHQEICGRNQQEPPRSPGKFHQDHETRGGSPHEEVRK